MRLGWGSGRWLAATLAAGCLLLQALPAAAVVDGEPVAADEAIAASAAALRLGNAEHDFLGLCSGALIADDLVVTAAHCIQGDPAHSVILFGTDVNDAGAERRDVLSWTLHPAWKRNSPRDRGDLALVRFRGAAPAGRHRMDILPRGMPIDRSDRIALAGYGVENAVDQGGVGVLRRTVTRILHPRGQTEMVVGAWVGSACSGDSGGPVYVQKGEHLYLLGVISFVSSRNCRGNGVITDALAVRDWLTAAIRGRQAN